MTDLSKLFPNLYERTYRIGFQDPNDETKRVWVTMDRSQVEELIMFLQCKLEAE